MEETMILKGLREVTSSELQMRGGAKKSTFSQIVDKIRNFIDFLSDYIPQIIKGFTDGLTGVPLLR
ncbi:MAG: hypothetical protein KBT00_02895 [Bacteroidales bacterium]|nr:hypothetical protein [Candidatus Cacconaster merdequi]